MTDETERAAKATQYLVDTAADIGAAKARQVRADAMLKVVKALLMQDSAEKSAAAQEREAYAHEKYQLAIDDLYEAVKDYETLRARREAAVQRIEYWRSLNANQRAAERGYGSAR